jgi:hypothetical protein
VLKRVHDPALDIFDRGIAVLRRDDQVAGHVATTLSSMWSPSRPLSRQDWVWLLIVWADGDRERPVEDYPPWSIVREIQAGRLTWEDGDHAGVYRVEWVPGDEREAAWRELGISLDDF